MSAETAKFIVSRRTFTAMMGAAAALPLLGGHSAAQEQKDTTLRLAVSDFGGETLDPALSDRFATLTTMIHMYDTLLEIGPNSELVPGIAESWEVDASGLVWTFKLRQGVQFHEDFGELTSADVAFSLNRFMHDKAQSSGGAVLRATVAKIEEVDPYTLKIYNKEPSPNFLYILSPHQQESGIIFSKKYLTEGAGDDFDAQSKLLNEKPIGSGPFRFVSRELGNSITYEALPAHWRATPQFKTLEILLVPEPATQMAMLRTGEVDIISVSGDQVQEAKDNGLDVHSVPGALNIWVNFMGTYRPGAQGKPTTDVRVRKALSMAIDRKQILEAVLAGYGNLPGTPLMTGPATADINQADYTDWAAEISRYDPAEAKKLLAEAGYPDGFSGIKFFSYTRAGTPFLPKLGEIITAQWAELGVQAEIVAMDYGSFREHYVRADINDTFNAGDAGTHSSSPRFDALGVFINNYLYNGGHVQLMNDPELDAGIEKAAAMTDDAERAKLVHDLMKRVNDSWVAPPLFDMDALFAANPKVVTKLEGYPSWPFLGRVYEKIGVAA